MRSFLEVAFTAHRVYPLPVQVAMSGQLFKIAFTT